MLSLALAFTGLPGEPRVVSMAGTLIRLKDGDAYMPATDRKFTAAGIPIAISVRVMIDQFPNVYAVLVPIDPQNRRIAVERRLLLSREVLAAGREVDATGIFRLDKGPAFINYAAHGVKGLAFINCIRFRSVMNKSELNCNSTDYMFGNFELSSRFTEISAPPAKWLKLRSKIIDSVKSRVIGGRP